ncbi:MAG: hypothetical protein HKN31_06845 [Pricia sp.]|nr:hypothetical protein [Pricia sp.]
MNSRKKIPVLILLLVTTLFYGQQKPDSEKIQSLKVAFITERLDLTRKEAQKFWPIYNEYEEKREELRQRERNQIRAKIKDADGLSEKEAQDLLKQYIVFEEDEEALDKSFLEEVSKEISAKKTLLLLRSEEEFKRQLIRQYRNRRSGNNR